MGIFDFTSGKNTGGFNVGPKGVSGDWTNGFSFTGVPSLGAAIGQPGLTAPNQPGSGDPPTRQLYDGTIQTWNGTDWVTVPGTEPKADPIYWNGTQHIDLKTGMAVNWDGTPLAPGDPPDGNKGRVDDWQARRDAYFEAQVNAIDATRKATTGADSFGGAAPPGPSPAPGPGPRNVPGAPPSSPAPRMVGPRVVGGAPLDASSIAPPPDPLTHQPQPAADQAAVAAATRRATTGAHSFGGAGPGGSTGGASGVPRGVPGAPPPYPTDQSPTQTQTSALTAPTNLTPDIQGMLKTYTAGRPISAITPTTVGKSQQAVAGTTTAPTVGPQQYATAATMTAPKLGPAAQGAASQANASLANAATIDQTNSNQTRAQQELSLAGLTAAANGTVPSAAELQLRQTRDQNIANQLALASALQGRSTGAALKQASDVSGMINAKAAADAAILRANEQAAARGQLSTALQGVRGSDIDVATSQGQLANTANITNANNQTLISQGNADRTTNVSTSNAAQINQMLQHAADLESTAGTTNANNATHTSEYNAGQGNALTKEQADLESTAGVTNANNATTASTTNANNSATLTSKQADITSTESIDNVINTLKARGLDDEQIRSFVQSMITGQGQQLNYGVQTQRNLIDQAHNQAEEDIQRAAAKWGQIKDVASGVGAGAAAIAGSDAVKKWWSGLGKSGPVDPTKAVSDPTSPAYDPTSPGYDPESDRNSPAWKDVSSDSSYDRDTGLPTQDTTTSTDTSGSDSNYYSDYGE